MRLGVQASRRATALFLIPRSWLPSSSVGLLAWNRPSRPTAAPEWNRRSSPCITISHRPATRLWHEGIVARSTVACPSLPASSRTLAQRVLARSRISHRLILDHPTPGGNHVHVPVRVHEARRHRHLVPIYTRTNTARSRLPALPIPDGLIPRVAHRLADSKSAYSRSIRAGTDSICPRRIRQV